MALQADYIDGHNQLHEDCYWKIGAGDGFIGGKERISCKIYCYEDKSDADLNQNELIILEFDLYYDLFKAENIMTQIYEDLKTDSIFENAIDV